MYCKRCGTKQKEGQKFCPKCGMVFVVSEDSKCNPVLSNDMGDGSEKTCDDEKDKPISDNKGYSSEASHSRPSFPMKWIITIISLILLIGIFIWGWNNLSDIFVSNEKDSPIEGIPFKSSENGKWGMLSLDGTILFEDEYKDEPTPVCDGRFFVKNGNGLWEIFSAEEHPQKIGDDYLSLGTFYQGVAPAVKKNERITLIDKEGNVISVLDKSGSQPITRIGNFHYGYALFYTDDAVGIINTKGEILLDARKYCEIFHIAPKAFLALDSKYKDETTESNLIYDVIDPVGEKKGTIKMAKYEGIMALDDGYFGIKQISDGEVLYGIMDMNGEVIVKPSSKTKGIYNYLDGKYIFSNGEYWGVRTVKDEVLIRAKYDAIYWASSDRIWACSIENGRRKMELVDLSGNKITSDSYQDALPFFDEKHAFVQITDKSWGIINNKGDELKKVPDIYTIGKKTADAFIVSDYIDIDAIVSAIKMTPEGFGGFGINMNPTDLIKNYNENCDNCSKIPLDPNSANFDRLSYQKQVLNGIDMTVEVYYQGYMTETGNMYYDETIEEWIQQPTVWTKEPPSYIRMSVSGSKLGEQANFIYKKLLAIAKTYGEVVQETDYACIIALKNKNEIVVVNTGSEVWAMVKSFDSSSNENIEQYTMN